MIYRMIGSPDSSPRFNGLTAFAKLNACVLNKKYLHACRMQDSCNSSITMWRLVYATLTLLLSIQLVIADSPWTDPFPRTSKASSLATKSKSLLSALLVRRGKFNPRATNSCPTGYRKTFLNTCIKYNEMLTLLQSYVLAIQTCVLRMVTTA